MATNLPSYDYVAYIDESGDPGLSSVRPINPTGSSEWLVVAGALIKASDESSMDDWLSSMMDRLCNFKARDVHFNKLTGRNKLIACEFMSRRPVQIFSVCSNKKNMVGYNNPFAAMRSLDRNWFYCWLTRVLLERITFFVRKHSIEKSGSPKRVKLVFSTRGGLSYSQMSAYFELLKLQTRVGGLSLEMGQVYFDVLSYKLVEILPHHSHSGLKFADISASAFFRACDIYQTNDLNNNFAKALKPRVAFIEHQAPGEVEGYKTYAGYGLKLLPSLRGSRLRSEQKAIFEFYGYPRQWWDPTPPTPSPYRLATVVNRGDGRPE